MYNANDVANAQRVVDSAKKVHVAAEGALILSGAWEADATAKFLQEEGANVALRGGEVSGLQDAIVRYKERHPDAFIELSKRAQNTALPRSSRFSAAYQEVLKTRERRRQVVGRGRS